jgi:5-methyltetrahydrofolate--homocysteine methyltransferase
MQSPLERLRDGQVLVADGAMGTLLMQMGLESGKCPEAVNLEKPEILEEIARRYLDAGADIIQTNTFGGSPLKLAQYSLGEETARINRRAAAAVRRAVAGKAYVAASCGPTGKLLQPYGDIDPDEVLAAFETQIRALVNEGVDMICIETMTDLAEATMAVKAAKSIAPSIPVSATMTFDAASKGFFTIMGTSIQQAAEGLTDAGADIVGSNCGNGSENMVKIAAEFRKHTELPLIIQSNAGIPAWQGEELIYPETPAFMAEQARWMIEAGVSIVGGCCGTTPEHVSALRGMVDSIISRQTGS